jgi:hypothetical protein
VAQATAAAEAAAVPVEAAGKHELNMLCDNRPHQARPCCFVLLSCCPPRVLPSASQLCRGSLGNVLVACKGPLPLQRPANLQIW